VKRCRGNREFPIGDFPITTSVWGPSVGNKDRCHRSSKFGICGVRESRHHRCQFPDRENPDKNESVDPLTRQGSGF
jgi:hypothetical protein